VLHAQMPRTLEAWTQEVGRAGRDGQPSWCELFFFAEDVAVQRNFVAWANPSLEYLVGVYETLKSWGERAQAKDLDDLRDELLVKQRADNRVSVCLKWFEVLGLTEGSFETHDLRVVRDLDPAEFGELVGTEEKERADLEALWTMTRFASAREECRRVSISRHFDLPPPDVPCGACDFCTSAEAWLATHLQPRPVAERGASIAAEGEAERASRGEAAFQRGDWVQIDGRHLGQVVRVDGSGRKLRLLVESAGDLARRLIDPRRVRVERLQR
jgi:superfamily II DNA helicase RecQ